MSHAIQAENLCKAFRSGVVAVSGLDLAVRHGSVYGLVGRNGAGKTTALRLLMGLLRPDSGRTAILGADMWEAPRQLRQQVAYVSQNQQLPGWMTLEELQRYVSHFYDTWDNGKARELARRWNIPRNRPVGQLSNGEQRRIALMLALAARPKVVLLDEPAAGLDPIARRELLASLVEAVAAGDGCTLLFSTHLVNDLERVADQVGFMDRGRLTLSTGLEELLQSTKRVQVIFAQPTAPRDFAIPGALRTQIAGPVVTAVARLANEAQLEPIRQIPGARLNIFPIGLEEIFIELYGAAGNAPGDNEAAPGPFDFCGRNPSGDAADED